MRRFLILPVLALSAAVSPASAESTKDRVERLESQMLEMQNASSASAMAAQRIDRLEAEIRSLTGRVEELTYQLDQSSARIEAMSAVLAGDTLGAPPAAPGVAGPVDLTGAGDAIADQLSGGGTGDIELPFEPNAAFDYANSFLLRGDYARAQAAFELYLSAFPRHPRAADAQFRLGEIHLATGANAEAADAFIAHIRNYPNDPRSAEAYVKLGAAFARLGQKEESCKVLRTMKGKFPSASPEVLDRANREMAANGC